MSLTDDFAVNTPPITNRPKREVRRRSALATRIFRFAHAAAIPKVSCVPLYRDPESRCVEIVLKLDARSNYHDCDRRYHSRSTRGVAGEIVVVALGIGADWDVSVDS